jgi:hypothetical protein
MRSKSLRLKAKRPIFFDRQGRLREEMGKSGRLSATRRRSAAGNSKDRLENKDDETDGCDVSVGRLLYHRREGADGAVGTQGPRGNDD